MQSSSFSDYKHFSISVALSSVLSSLSSCLKVLLISIAQSFFLHPSTYLSACILTSSLFHYQSVFSKTLFSCFLSYLSLFWHTRHPSIPLSTHPPIILFLSEPPPLSIPLYLFLHLCPIKLIYSSTSPNILFCVHLSPHSSVWYLYIFHPSFLTSP